MNTERINNVRLSIKISYPNVKTLLRNSKLPYVCQLLDIRISKNGKGNDLKSKNHIA